MEVIETNKTIAPHDPIQIAEGDKLVAVTYVKDLAYLIKIATDYGITLAAPLNIRKVDGRYEVRINNKESIIFYDTNDIVKLFNLNI